MVIHRFACRTTNLTSQDEAGHSADEAREEGVKGEGAH